MKKDTSGSAFPEQKGFKFKSGDNEQTEITVTEGMTKREYFAAKAMQGLMMNPNTEDFVDNAQRAGMHPRDYCAWCAVDMADALIKELEK